ncbi:MAG: TolC family protein [Gammaproteobacteria bacterium]
MSSCVSAASGRLSFLFPARASIAASLAAILFGCAAPPTAPPTASATASATAYHPQWHEARVGRHEPVAPRAHSADATRGDQDGLPEDATLDHYIGYALRDSPELDAAWHRWRAAAERVTQARTLPDPQLGFAVVFDQVDTNAGHMGERYSISQMFPWFGKLGLRGDVAFEEAQAEARLFEATRLELAERVTRAWFELAWLNEAIATAGENLALMRRFESVARARYRVGAVSQADVNRAQVELGRLDDQLRSLQDMRGPAAAALNAVLGRSAHARLPGAFDAPSRQPAGAWPEQEDDYWLALARARNPGLAAAQHRVMREEQAVALAQRNYYPDITLGLEYGRNSARRMAQMDGGGSDTVAAMVSFSLPIRRGRIAAGVREAEARLGAASRQAEAREYDLEAELKQALFVHRDSTRRVALYGGTLLPKARQSLATTEAAYRAGDAGFSDLVDAQRVLLEFALAHERAAADRAQALARIRTLVGEAPEPTPRTRHPEQEVTP